MFALIKKEINGFFSTITGYIVVVMFLLINSLIMWVFPGQFNILDGGYATIDTLFIIAPWVFLFLVPAVTMRLIADEKRTGTIEILLTRPLTDFQIIGAKYIAGVALVLFSLVPTLLYFLSVYLLGDEVGNIDTGGTWGSFIGLFFLAAIYVAIGIFASSITENQIVAFITGMTICFVFFIGFEALSTLPQLKSINSIIVNIGINEHYKSISRGVIDSRDVIYYLAIITSFLLLTRTVLESRKW